MGQDSDEDLVAAYADRVLNLDAASLGDEYRYQSLSLCVIDAVFSISIRYAIVQGVIERYCKRFGLRRLRENDSLPPIEDQECITAFCARPEQNAPAAMAEGVYGSRNRTSPQNGILKAEAALRFARVLQSFGVEYFQDVPKVADDARFEADIRSIPGQRSGLSLQYFWMLAGSDDFVKPDRMVLRFLSTALGRTVVVKESALLLKAVCDRLVDRYPGMTPRLLDHEIWKFQRNTTNKALRDSNCI